MAKKKKATPAPKPAKSRPSRARARSGGHAAGATPKRAHARQPAAPGRVRVRMYRQGLGDCFLIGLPRAGARGGEFFILIDCGVILGTPRADELIRDVVDDVAATTGSHLDVLIATHEHWDHVSGFHPDKGRFAKFTIDAVWLAWTEDPHDATAQALRRKRAAKLAALWVGFRALQDRLKTSAAAGPGDEARASLERAAEVLSFFGIDAEADAPPAHGGLGAAAVAAVSKTGAAMTWVREATSDPKFLKPGDVVELPGLGGVRAYVLGPPTDTRQLLKNLPTKAGQETYDEPPAVAAVAERGFFGAASPADPAALDTSAPFDKKYRVDPEAAGRADFFHDHYFGSGEADAENWRRIDADWTAAASGLALQLDSDTNNTSLALAFELPDGRVLLFPGDAQVGNWESWHADPDGKPRTWTVGTRSVNAEHLLNRTVLYKVGHHGSHNATLRARGLEMMTDPSLAAMVPVDVFIAHEKKHWNQMPFDPLMARLAELTRGRLYQADRPLAPAPAGRRASAKSSAHASAPAVAVSDSDKTLTVVVDKTGATAARPLFVEYVL